MDPELKSFFRHPLIIEMSIRSSDPEIAEKTDFSTLEALGPALVGDELARRHPEMLWIARTRDPEGHIVIVLHLPDENDPLMAVRVAVLGRQTLDELRRRMRPPPAPGTLTALPLVFHLGTDRWTAAESLEELLSRWDAGEFRLVAREPEGAGDRG